MTWRPGARTLRLAPLKPDDVAVLACHVLGASPGPALTAMLAKAGLIATRPGASGGAWLLERPEDITLDRVLRAVGACAHLGCPPPGAKGCPVGERIPIAVRSAIEAADKAAAERLSRITVADLLNGPPAAASV